MITVAADHLSKTAAWLYWPTVYIPSAGVCGALWSELPSLPSWWPTSPALFAGLVSAWIVELHLSDPPTPDVRCGGQRGCHRLPTWWKDCWILWIYLTYSSRKVPIESEAQGKQRLISFGFFLPWILPSRYRSRLPNGARRYIRRALQSPSKPGSAVAFN